MVKMHVVFFGTPLFAVPALRALLESRWEVSAVFTQPDKPGGRGQRVQSGPVKLLAQREGIPVFQPVRIRDEDNRVILDRLAPDFIVVAAYGQILPPWVLSAGRIAPVNIHASLLPRYRGAAPVAWAIINGDTTTGVTTMLMQEELDAGAILMQEEVPIPQHITAGELTEQLSQIGARILIQTLDGLSRGTIRPIPQNPSLVTWAPRITKQMAQISWEKTAVEIHNQIRGMNPWPGAYTAFRGIQLKIWRSSIGNTELYSEKPPGTFLGCSQDGINIQCGRGTCIEILEVQAPARAKTSGRAFANGARLKPGELIC